MVELIECDVNPGLYNLPCQEMIVELSNGTHVYLSEGFGGMDELMGGQYRWQHGIAVKLLPTDTLASIRVDDGAVLLSNFDRMVHGYDTERPLLDWSGSKIGKIAEEATK
jgi:hypothetical protein